MNKSTLEQKSKAHYDSFPFDFMSQEDEEKISELQPLPFREFVEEYVSPATSVIDVGCGPGRATLFLKNSNCKLVSFDLSIGSIELSRKRAPHSNYVCGTNLSLPFRDEQFEVVVSDGVIHHTPDAKLAFFQNARLLKKGGHLYCAVYQRKRYYYYIYTYIGVPIRWLEKHAVGRLFVYLTLLPVYYLVHLIKSRGKRSWAGAKNFFYDYIITPKASFHTYDEMNTWGQDFGLKLVKYDNKRVGNVHAFVFERVSTG